MISCELRFERRRRRDAFKIRSRAKDRDYIISLLRSNKHLSIILENSIGMHLCCVTTKTKENNGLNAESLANKFFEKINELNLDSNLKFIFNKSGYPFHGTVATVARTLSEKGIKCC